MKIDKQNIFIKIKELLDGQYGVSPDLIKPEARLGQDIGLDSMDSVELDLDLTERGYTPKDQLKTLSNEASEDWTMDQLCDFLVEHYEEDDDTR